MKILFFTYGDASDQRTWSNVPFCFSKALEENGHEVERVNLAQFHSAESLWNKSAGRIIRKLFKGSQYSFFRSRVAAWLIDNLIRKTINRRPDADLCIFTTFSFYNRHRKVPSLLFCDWSYETHLERCGHKPYFFEKWFIKSEREALTHSALAVSLFPECARAINQQLGYEQVKWGGVSAVNIIDNLPFDGEEIARISIDSKKILFIGDGKYLNGAKLLVEAFRILKQTDPTVQLDIIGLTQAQLGITQLPAGVNCHGYLNKGNPADNTTYYRLLREAGVFCNPTEVWGGFSSTIEVMYYHTPVVVSPYEDFVAQFGQEITFGAYNPKFDATTLAATLTTILNAPPQQRHSLCHEAHKAVNHCTWRHYSARLLDMLPATINKK